LLWSPENAYTRGLWLLLGLSLLGLLALSLAQRLTRTGR